MGWSAGKIGKLLWAVLLVPAVVVQCETVNYDQYHRMPRVFLYDQYDECLNDDPTVPTVFCVVKAIVQPNGTSPVWALIEQRTRNWKQHLNHAHLERGMCVRHCAAKLASLDLGTANATGLLVPKFEINYPYIIKDGSFRNTEAYRENYSDLLGMCINYDLQQQYGLRAYTEIEYCNSNRESYPIDNLEIAFLVVLALLMLTVLLSSWYDHSCRHTHGLQHYQEELPSRTSMAMASFSIIRNWYRISSRAEDPLSRQIRFVHAIRLIIFMAVNLGHNVFYAQPRTALAIEQRYHHIPTMLIINGAQVVTTYFVISSVMLVTFVVTTVQDQGKKLGIVEIVVATIARYIRLTPVYAFVMLFEATWLVRYMDGPLWSKGIETGRNYCRKNWWTNLLYINNYYKVDEPCMQHTWYLAADFHLFIYGLVVCSVILRFPKRKHTILWSLVFVAFVVNAIEIYLREYEAISLLPPEQLRFFFWYWKMFQHTYLPTHMYLINYNVGLVTAFYLMDLRHKSNKFSTTFKWLWVLCLLAVPTWFICGNFFYVNLFETPSIWMSLFFPFGRLLYGCMMLTLAIGFMMRASKPFVRLLDIPFFTILGRLTYSAYASRGFSSLVMSYLLAWILCLTLESPFTALQKQLMLHFQTPRDRRSEIPECPKQTFATIDPLEVIRKQTESVVL